MGGIGLDELADAPDMGVDPFVVVGHGRPKGPSRQLQRGHDAALGRTSVANRRNCIEVRGSHRAAHQASRRPTSMRSGPHWRTPGQVAASETSDSAMAATASGGRPSGA